MDDYVKELGILEDLLVTVENYIGPYVWGNYRIVILPPAFPFGGMENPLLTFASPSIMTGDGSGLAVVIHEIVHSWTGNLVTNANWSSFWLNEGFTCFLEYKGLALSSHFGPEIAELHTFEGRSTLKQTIERIGVNHNFTSLTPITDNIDPDDSFS
jgi:leukotriene-A4 hydrolase